MRRRSFSVAQVFLADESPKRLSARSQAPSLLRAGLVGFRLAQPAQTFQTLLASRPLIGPKQLVFTIRQLRLAFLPVNPREDIMDSIQRRVQLQRTPVFNDSPVNVSALLHTLRQVSSGVGVLGILPQRFFEVRNSLFGFTQLHIDTAYPNFGRAGSGVKRQLL